MGTTDNKPRHWADDAWGGLAAMLVALPSAIAFGVAVYAQIGGGFSAQGALAGVLGATALGLVASAWGGAPRLISAPCAPAVAILSALALELARSGAQPAAIMLMLAVVGLLAGVLQLVFGLLGLGRLIKYMPYPVVSGFLTGVGLIIILGQIPALLGAPADGGWQRALLSPQLWHWQSMLVALVTIVVVLLAPRWTRAVPAVILGLLAGLLAYGGLAAFDPALRVLDGNRLLVGALRGEGPAIHDAVAARWAAAGDLGFADVYRLLVPAATLAVLLSIDTLKTCVVLDALTRSRHDSNRTLVGQGLANMASAAIGGMAGAGTMGATLVNVSSGGRTRWSGLVEGGLSLLAFVLLASLLAWLPIGALAGILCVVGVRMFDRGSLHYLKSRDTVLDFAVIATVVVVALAVGLIAASGAGIVLAVALFVRAKVGGSVVARKVAGDRIFSRRVRTTAEMQVLQSQGAQTMVFELQGSLFFGTADKLYTALAPELATRRYVVLDFRRVQSVDVSAAHVLEQARQQLADRNAMLLFCHLPARVPSGQDVQRYLMQVGLIADEPRAQVFEELDAALEWVEDRLIEQAGIDLALEAPLQLREMDLFAQRKSQTLTELEACMRALHYRAGARIFSSGDTGDDIYLIRRGVVRIVLPLADGRSHHLASFGRGGFFGEMAFLDRQPRSADAIAFTDCDLFVLSRQRFDELVAHHKMLGMNLMEGLALLLAERLRQANTALDARDDT